MQLFCVPPSSIDLRRHAPAGLCSQQGSTTRIRRIGEPTGPATAVQYLTSVASMKREVRQLQLKTSSLIISHARISSFIPSRASCDISTWFKF